MGDGYKVKHGMSDYYDDDVRFVKGHTRTKPVPQAKPTSYLKQDAGGPATDDLRTQARSMEGMTHPGTMVTARRAKADIAAGASTDVAKQPMPKDQSRLEE